MTGKNTRIRLLAAAALLAALTGCGIQPTGVVDVGEPATGAKRPGGSGHYAKLFWLSPTGLQQVQREVPADFGPQPAVSLLMKGPDEAERMRGMQSRLPGITGEIRMTQKDDRISIQLPMPVGKLDPIARSQFVCTAAANAVTDGRPITAVRVELAGGGGSLMDLVCYGNVAIPAVTIPTTAPSGAPPAPATGEPGGAGVVMP